MRIVPVLLGVTTLVGLVAGLRLHSANTELTANLALAQAEKARLDVELAAGTARQNGLQQRLVTQDATLAETRSRLAAADARTGQLTREAGELRLQLEAGAQSVVRLEQETGELHHELALLKLNTPAVTAEELEGFLATISSLENRVQDLEGEIAAAQPIVPAAGRSFPVLSVAEGNAFVILAFGADEGARTAQELRITRGTEAIATVHISEIRDQLAIAQVQPDTLRSGLRKGDSASIPSSP